MEEINQGREDPAVAAARRAEWESGASDRAFAKLRQKRNELLHATDWWASSDLEITQDQIDYRQALRDLPANTPDPGNSIWPTAPE